MISLVIGAPGEGKSAYCVEFVIAETLLKTNRQVATNITIDRKKLREYIEKEGGEYDPIQLVVLPHVQEGEQKTFSYFQRLPFCSTLDCGDYDSEEFSSVSSHDGWTTFCKIEKITTDYQPSCFWESCPKNSVVVIDEAAEYLNAYGFGASEAGKALGKYARLHRHLGHDVYFSLQAREHMGKQARDLAAREILLYNFYQHPVLGIKFKIFYIRQWDLSNGKRVGKSKIDLKFYNYKALQLYNTSQHNSSVATKGVSYIDKKLRKRKFSDVLRAFLRSPLKMILSLTLVMVIFAVYYLFTLAGNVTDIAAKTQTTTPTQNESANPDHVSNDLTDTVAGLNPERKELAAKESKGRDSTRGIITRFKSREARGYKLPSSDGSRNRK